MLLGPERAGVDSGSSREENLRMNIAVFGASGNCGAHFVRHAAARGHQVTAVTRGDAQLPRGVQSRKGDPLDAGFVADTVAGHEVVFSGLGMRSEEHTSELQ